MSAPDGIVFIVDDDPLVRGSVEDLIQSAGLAAQTFGSAREFMDAKHPDLPACLVLDIQLPDRSGLEIQHELAQAGIEIPIVFLTGHGDIPMSVHAMKAGAAEFLTKPFRSAELLSAVRQALARNREVRDEHAKSADLRRRFESLTPREREVLNLVTDGLLNKQAAGELGITELTIKAHRGQVMRKMQAGSLAELVRMVERLKSGPFPPPATKVE
jgi:FixJ family two-component response regulator